MKLDRTTILKTPLKKKRATRWTLMKMILHPMLALKILNSSSTVKENMLLKLQIVRLNKKLERQKS